MLAIADQSAAPNGLKIVEGTHGYPGVTFELKNKFFFCKIRTIFFQNSSVFPKFKRFFRKLEFCLIKVLTYDKKADILDLRKLMKEL